MTARPILLRPPEVLALLAAPQGKGIEIRRRIEPQPDHKQLHEWKGEVLYDGEHRLWWWKKHCWDRLMDSASERAELAALCPLGGVGGRLWGRETFYCDCHGYPNAPRPDMLRMLEYRADHDCRTWEAGCPCNDENGRSSWRPSVHMPRWASRLDLDIAAVDVVQNRDIDEWSWVLAVRVLEES